MCPSSGISLKIFLGRSLTRLLCPHSELRLSHVYCTILFYLWLLAKYSVHEECVNQTNMARSCYCNGGQRTGARKHQLWSHRPTGDVRVLAPRPYTPARGPLRFPASRSREASFCCRILLRYFVIATLMN